jgi:hypothetical protein
MLKACLGKSIPDVPLGNPTAGTTFDHQRGQMIETKMSTAGCPVEHTLMAMIPTPSPVPQVQYTVRKNHRGNCPPKDYSGSMCDVMSSTEAQQQCSRDKYCRFYVWSGPFGHQKTKGALTMPHCLWMCAIVPPVFRSWNEGDGTGFSGWESGYVADRSTPSPTPPLVLRQLVMHIRLSGFTHVFSKDGFGKVQQRALILAVADAADVPATSIKVVEVVESRLPHSKAPVSSSSSSAAASGSSSPPSSSSSSSSSSSTTQGGGRRLGEAGRAMQESSAVHKKGGNADKTKTIIVTVTLTTYDAELERQTEEEVGDGGFARLLETHLKRHGIVPTALGVNERISEGPPDDGGQESSASASAVAGSTVSSDGPFDGSEQYSLPSLLLLLALAGFAMVVLVRGGHMQEIVNRLASERRVADESSAEESAGLTSGGGREMHGGQ